MLKILCHSHWQLVLPLMLKYTLVCLMACLPVANKKPIFSTVHLFIDLFMAVQHIVSLYSFLSAEQYNRCSLFGKLSRFFWWNWINHVALCLKFNC